MQIQAKTALESNTVRTLIVGIVALLGAVGVRVSADDKTIQQIADAVVVGAPLISMVIAALFRKSDNIIVDSDTKAMLLKNTGTTEMTAVPFGSRPSGGNVPPVPPKGSPYPDTPGYTDSTVLATIFASVALILCSSGCMSRAEHATFRKGMQAACAPIHREHLTWSKELVKPKEEQKLPNLNDGETDADRSAWLNTREKWHEEYDATMRGMEANDQK